jgi:hypothetical protein
MIGLLLMDVVEAPEDHRGGPGCPNALTGHGCSAAAIQYLDSISPLQGLFVVEVLVRWMGGWVGGWMRGWQHAWYAGPWSLTGIGRRSGVRASIPGVQRLAKEHQLTNRDRKSLPPARLCMLAGACT